MDSSKNSKLKIFSALRFPPGGLWGRSNLKFANVNLEHWLFAAILFLIFFLRIPTLFEPYWYGDEGIFAAVARNLNLGGVLYDTAWDNKPPLIYLTYSTIFRFFGVSMFNLHLAATISVMICASFIYLIVRHSYNAPRALIAMSLFGTFSIFRVFEGNLALTEIFMITFITFAFWFSIKRVFDKWSLLASGALIAIASLYKQVGALEAGALGIYAILVSKNLKDLLTKGVAISAGFIAVLLVTASYFAKLNLLPDFIFAAYTYYSIYLNESPQYAILINVLKYGPVLIAIFYAIYKRKKKKLNIFNLFILWLSLSFLGSYFSGRAYGHYIIQSLPAISIVLATISFKLKLEKVSLVSCAIIFVLLFSLTRLLFPNIFVWNPQDQIKYYQNFFGLINGKPLDKYNDFFDHNVNPIMAARDFLEKNNAAGKSVYIWGDYAWLYAISNVWNPSRYVTSFHVFGVPSGKEEVISDLMANPPVFILKPESSIGYFEDLEKLLASNYTLGSRVQKVEIFVRKGQTDENNTEKEK